MHEDFLLSNSEYNSKLEQKNLDSLFDNLTEDIATVNKYISEVNKQNKTNEQALRDLYDDRQKLEKSKLDFEEYCRNKEEEFQKIKIQNDEYLVIQKEKIKKAEEDFRKSMSSSLSSLELEKKTLEIEKDKLGQEKTQFEAYKDLEISRLNQAKEQFEGEKKQFEKYKEISNKKIELDSNTLEEKCLKFKELMNQFNSNFKMGIDIEE